MVRKATASDLDAIERIYDALHTLIGQNLSVTLHH